MQNRPDFSPVVQVPEDVSEALEILGNAANMSIVHFLSSQPGAHLAQIGRGTGNSRAILQRRLLELENAGVLVVDTNLPIGKRGGQLLHYYLDSARVSELVGAWTSWMKKNFPDSGL